MSYTSYKEDASAVAAAQRLASERRKPGAPGDLAAQMPLLLDQIQGEAGLFAPALAERALNQTNGELGRAVGLLRAWGAVLPRLATPTLGEDDVRVVRRLTPTFRNPEDGQYLGVSPDHAPRLLQTDDAPEAEQTLVEQPAAEPTDAPHTPQPLEFSRAVTDLEASGVIAHGTGAHSGPRSALLAALAQGDTGALTTGAYAVMRTFGNQREPLIGELRTGYVPVQVIHPDLGIQITLGEVPVCTTELIVERRHAPDAQDSPVGRFYLGIGATIGHVERRSISAALLDATCHRDNVEDDVGLGMLADPELLTPMLDGAAACGQVEHLKLPHHVQFQSKLNPAAYADDAVEDDEA